MPPRPDIHKRLFVGFMAICFGAVALCLGVSVAVSGGSLTEAWRDWRTLVLLVVALAALLACSGAAAYVIRGALEPLHELRDRVRESARSRYGTEIDSPAVGDLHDLAEEIERLRVELTGSVETCQSEAERLLELSRLPGMIDARRGEGAASRAALDAILRAVGGVAGGVYLLTVDETTLALSAEIGLKSPLSDEARSVPVSHGFMGRVLNWGQALVLDETGAQEWVEEVRHNDAAPAAVACVPLKSADTTLGVMNLIVDADRPLGPAEVAMLETIAAQVGATVGNARVYEAARRRMGHIAALLDTSAEVARGRRMRQVLDLVLSKVRDLTGVQKCAVVLAHEDGQQYSVATHAGLGDEFVKRLPEVAPAGPTGKAVRELRPVSVASVDVDPSVAELFVAYREERIESLLAVPLLGADRTYGTIEIYRERKGQFSREETQLLSILANQAAVALTNAQLHEQSLKRLSALETIIETMALFGASSEPDQIVQTAVRKVREVFHCHTCYVCFRNPETGALEPQSAIGLPETATTTGPLAHGLDPLKCWAVQKGTPFIVRDAEWDLSCEQEPCEADCRSYVCAPLTAGGECFGVMHMSSNEVHAFTDEDVQLFCTIAEQVAIASQRAQLFQQVQELATTDPMTGAHNYRRFREQLDRELTEAKRYERTLSVILMDLDNFKEHNDTFGHPSGDEVLRKLAKVISSCLRAVDFFARYGGEEFVVVLPETDKDGAAAVAEKIRSEVEATTFYGDANTPEVKKTLSLGVAAFPDDGDADERLISAADRALYHAKENGRNRVEVADAGARRHSRR